MNHTAHAMRDCVRTNPAHLPLLVADMLTWYSPDEVQAALDTLTASEHTMNAQQAIQRFLHPKPAEPKYRVLDIAR